ncbi:MAG TPA: cytochrome C oxidase subunit IV family protein [Chloroflexota bacterium]|nr:cytochrome C oxidase subunit IV family protein [Chloroflexota bacterium]HUM68210.1 cytochrome C oxidase subunit IV family protein [Chloroflexota bacterium]
MEKNEDWKKAAQRLGLYVFIGLMVLTLIEYAVSVYLNSTVGLFITMLLKSALIVYYFMHVYRLWREDSH